MDNLENELLNLGKENVEMPKSVRTKVDLSYHTFLELFKSRIMYYLMKLGDMNVND